MNVRVFGTKIECSTQSYMFVLEDEIDCIYEAGRISTRKDPTYVAYDICRSFKKLATWKDHAMVSVV